MGGSEARREERKEEEDRWRNTAFTYECKEGKRIGKKKYSNILKKYSERGIRAYVKVQENVEIVSDLFEHWAIEKKTQLYQLIDGGVSLLSVR